MSADETVSDTGPLIALTLIGQVDLLARLFTRVIVPRAVRQELIRVAPPEWVEVRDLSTPLDDLVLEASLDPGESAAITLALEMDAARILLDDLPARMLAEGLGLTVMGTLGVLILSKQRGFITTVRPLLDALRATNFYMSDRLYRRLLRSVGED